MPRDIRLLIFSSIFFVMIWPGLLFAAEDDLSHAPEIQPDIKIEEQTSPPDISVDENEESPDYTESEEIHKTISDPLEPLNRIFFAFNDKLYFWFLKPVARGYIVIAPEPVRVGVKNFFSNIFFPIRFANCLLQVKFQGAGNEIGRFLLNSTIGVAGFMDIAGNKLGIKAYDEDFGQTLGFYGLGNGFYINWPVIGPSSALDTVGLAGDFMLEPTYYLDVDTRYKLGLKAYKTVNNTSLSIGDYEGLKDAALDPYVAVRDAYIQYRLNKIKE
jgi:phospholipid-binding lipoprotein MlaA